MNVPRVSLEILNLFLIFFFSGQDYEVHTKCVTEEERYSGKGFQAKEKKGEKKQNAWVEMLQSVLDEQKTAPSNVLRIIETISKHNNTPRKKPKFVNFVKNVCGQKTNIKDIDQAWDLISVKLSALSNANDQNRNQNQNNDSVTSNGDAETKENGETENDKTDLQNGHESVENGKADDKKLENGEADNTIGKKLSKKQRKEEKKRQKYEAELQSAVAPPAEEEEETTGKKGKKKKNRTESLKSVNEEEVPQVDGKKQKKRKRQDTVGGAAEVVENGTENIENVPINKEKTQKKKLKVDGETAADESLCLHDQNVAKSEEAPEARSDKFDWHAVILSVLDKKDNEMPFKRLQKKVLSEYSEMTGREVDDRIADKFIKKLKSAPKVRVDKNRVYIEE